ncbi:MAG TPA: hypothetical protein VF950_14070 [Planctomycetota bacterium]
MRVWRSPLGLVAERDSRPLALVSTLSEELPGGPWREFVLIDLQGRVRRVLTPTEGSAAEDLGASVYAVRDGTLWNLRVNLTFGVRIHVKRSEDEIERGLVEVDDPDSLRLAATAGR